MMCRPWNLHGVPLSSFCPAQFQHPGPGIRKGETALPYPLPPGPCPAQESPLGLAKCVKKLGPCASAQAQRSFYDAQPASVFHPEPLQALSGPGGAHPPTLPGTLPGDLALQEAMAVACLSVGEVRKAGL